MATPGQGRILVMDDEPMICTLARSFLQRLGYQVEVARDGREALGLYGQASSQGQPFDLVIMDLTVPGGMGGLEAIKLLLELDPQAKVLVSSGYSNDPVMADFKASGFCGVVAKPYKMEDLSRVLQELMRTRTS